MERKDKLKENTKVEMMGRKEKERKRHSKAKSCKGSQNTCVFKLKGWDTCKIYLMLNVTFSLVLVVVLKQKLKMQTRGTLYCLDETHQAFNKLQSEPIPVIIRRSEQ